MNMQQAVTTTPAGGSPAHNARGIIQRRCACGASASGGGDCAGCKKKKRYLQRKRTGSAAAELPASVDRVLSSSGSPLDSTTRMRFGARFGHDFSGVRVHTDSHAAQSAREINAQAYTAGSNIVFDSGRYAPDRPAGQKLIAHELTHVIQQRHGSDGGVSRSLSIGSSTGAAEREAERNADRFHSSAALTAGVCLNTVARRKNESTTTTEVIEPTAPNSCGVEHHNAIAPAVSTSLGWLNTAVAALGRYISAPTNSANASTRTALNRHFHATDVATARTVRNRLNRVRTDIQRRGDPTAPDPNSRVPFAVECHDDTDTLCAVANAYISGDLRTYVFCPIFFNRFSALQRATSIVHEMIHTLVGLNITDRAYSYDRLLPFLTTAEALDNAESYAMFAQEMGTGSVPVTNTPRDVVDDECDSQTSTLARVAIARAERWNRRANTTMRGTTAADLMTTHLGNATAATRTAAAARYDQMADRFRSPLSIRCSSENCGGVMAYKREAVDRSGLGAGIGAAIGGVLGAVGGAVLGAFTGGIGGGILGGILGSVLGGGLGALIGLGIGSAASSDAAINLCPGWKNQGVEGDRVESLLAVAYETYTGCTQAEGRQYAALARAIYERRFPPPAN